MSIPLKLDQPEQVPVDSRTREDCRVLHPSPRCLVELHTERPDSGGDKVKPGIGSGYLVAEGWVLTAAHVVREATTLRAWVNPPADLATGEATVDQAGIVYVAGVDWALVPVSGHVVPPGFAPVVFAQLERESLHPVAVTAMGLPRHRLRDVPLDPHAEPAEPMEGRRPKMRAVLAAAGEIAPATGYNTDTAATPRTLTMTVIAGAGLESKDGSGSVWAGMSGAAVWAGRLVVGVVTRHEFREGNALLTVDPVPNSSDAAAIVPPAVQLLAPASATESIYREIARSLAPKVLVDRADEYALLEDFATDTERQWWWWEADAFAGKTALTAWWVGHRPTTASRPPSLGEADSSTVDREGVMVVSCFLRRTRGEDTADYVVETWADQLGVIASPTQQVPHQASTKGLVELRRLITAAAQHCQRLLLLVDGLDEYNPREPVPISDWLPAALPSNAALLVTSRTGAPNGIDRLDNAHPLMRHRHPLPASDVAESVHKAAVAEIEHAADDEPGGLRRQILGFLAAADASLTLGELTLLVNRERWRADPEDVKAAWRQHLSRTITQDPVNQALAFAHETLPGITRKHLNEDILLRLDSLHAWANQYAEQGWPDDTPVYLLHGYTRLLINLGAKDQSQLFRLVDLVTNPSRHERLLQDTEGDAAALQGITATIQVLTTDPARLGVQEQWQPGTCTHPDPDLELLIRVVWHRDRLHLRSHVPSTLPAVWARLGNLKRAENLANAIADRGHRARALTNAAKVLAAQGNRAGAVRLLTDAIRVADTITSRWGKAMALTGIAEALVAAGEPERARQIAEDVLGIAADADATPEPALLGGAALVLAAAAQFDEALEVADTIASPWEQVVALTGIARALSVAERPDRSLWVVDKARLVAGTINNRWLKASALGGIARALAAAKEPDQARQVSNETRRLVDQALPAADTIGDHGEKPLAIVAMSISGDVEFSKALSTPGTIGDRGREPSAMVGVARALVAFGQLDQALEVAANTDRRLEPFMLIEVAEALVAAGEPERARQIAEDVLGIATDPDATPELALLVGIVEVLVAAGEPERARQIAEKTLRIPGTINASSESVGHLAESLVAAGQIDEALQVADIIGDPDQQVSVLVGVAEALVAAGELERARQIAEKSLTIVNSSRGWIEAFTLARIAAVLTTVGEGYRARQIGGSAGREAAVLVGIAGAMAKAGKLEQARPRWLEALELASSISDLEERAEVRSRVAAVLAEAGEVDQALRIAGTMGGWKASGLAEIAVALAKAGQLEQARHICEEALQVEATLDASRARHFSVLAKIAVALAKAGQLEQARLIANRASRLGELPVDQLLVGLLVAGGRLTEALGVVAAVADDRARAAALNGAVLAVISKQPRASVEAEVRSTVARLLAGVWTVVPWSKCVAPLGLLGGDVLSRLVTLELGEGPAAAKVRPTQQPPSSIRGGMGMTPSDGHAVRRPG